MADSPSRYKGNKGLEYYKAYPRDFFEGVKKMRGPLRGFYRMVIDLIYMTDGFLIDDWSYISGHTGFGKTQCKRMMQELIVLGKIQADISGNDQVFTNKRSKSELFSSRKFQENQSNNALGLSKNKGLAEAAAGAMALPPQDHKTTRLSKPAVSLQSDLSRLLAKQREKAPSPKEKMMQWASEEAVVEYLKYRKGTKAKGTTDRAASIIANQLEIISKQGGNPDEALDMAQVQGWQGMKAEWYLNTKRQDNEKSNHNGRTANGGRMAGSAKATEIANRAIRIVQQDEARRGIDRDAREGFD